MIGSENPGSEPPVDPQPQNIAQYRIDALVARGGFGTVYKATDTTLDRTVALKLIDDPRRAEGLIAEAKNTSRIAHPGIAQVYQAGIDEPTGLAFIAFEWVEGPTLRAILRRGGLPLLQILRIGQDVSAALAAAHEQGLVHGDLKADNIVITESGRAKLLDFGLSVPDEVLGNEALWGTPAYMAPELLAGGARTPRSDLFALGVLLYELVTGILPFGGEDGNEGKVRERQKEPAPHPREERTDLPSDLADRMRSLVVRDPESRGPGAIELERILRLLRRSAERPRGRLLPFALLVIVLVAGWLFRFELGMVERPGGPGAGRGGTSVAPAVSVGVWNGPHGDATEESRTVRDFLALLLSGDDPGSALILAPTPPALTGTIELATGSTGPGEWTAHWESPTGRGTREEFAEGALQLARRIAERVKNDGASNEIPSSVDVPEAALLQFIEGVRATEDGDLAEARRSFASARESAGAFPEAAAWEAVLWVVEDRPSEALSLLAPLRNVPSAPAAILRAGLEIPIRDRTVRWGADHRLARLLDLALARHDPSVPDDELSRRIEDLSGIGLAWIARERVAIDWRAGDILSATTGLDRARLLSAARDHADLWRWEHAIALAGEDRVEAMDRFQDRLFELPPGSEIDWLKVPFLVQKGRLDPAISAAERLDPGAKSLRTAVLVLAIGGRFEEAIDRSRGIEDSFDPSGGSRIRGAVAMLEGDRDGATRALQEARQIDPSHPEIDVLLRFVESPPYEYAGELVAVGTALSRTTEPFRAIRRARSLRVGGDAAAGRRTLDGIEFVTDDLTVFAWPEVIYLAWLERITCLRAEEKADEARAEWKNFRRWWPEDRPEGSRVSQVAKEVEAYLEGGDESRD